MKPQRLRWTPLAVCLGAWGLGAVQAQPPLPAASPAPPLRLASGLAFSLALGEAAAPKRPGRTAAVAQQVRLAPSPDLLQNRGSAAAGMEDLLRNARHWLIQGRLDLARQNIEKLLLANPQSPAGWAELGNIALLEKQPEEAQKILDRLRQQHPQAPATHDLAALVRVYGAEQEELARMRLLARAGREKEAAEIARALFPDGPPQTGTLGTEYYRIVASTSQEPQASRATRQSAQSMYEQTGELEYRLIALEIDQAQGAPALPLAQAVEPLAGQPGIDPYRLRDVWRRILERLPASVAAQQRLKAYLRRYPDDTAVAELLQQAQDPINLSLAAAEQALEADNTAQAEAYLHTVLKERPQAPQALGMLGQIRFRQSRYAEAQQWLGLAAQHSDEEKWRDLLASARFWGLLQQADSAQAAGQLEQAAAWATQALRLQPSNPEALATLGQIRAAQGQAEAARQLFRQALVAQPGHSAALRGMVGVLIRAGRLEAAQAALDEYGHQANTSADGRALRNELRATVLSAQADLLVAKAQPGAALRLLEEAADFTPADPWLRHRIARIYLELAQPHEALQVMDEGMAHDDRSVEMRFARALIRNAANDYAGAVQDLEHVPLAQRTDAMQSLLKSSTVQAQIASINKAGANAAALLAEAENTAGDDDRLLWAVANAWFDQGEAAQAVAVFDRLAQRLGGPDKLSPAVRLDHAALLARARQAAMDERLATLLPALHALPGWEAPQAQRLAELTLTQRERAVEALAAAGQLPQARALASAPLWGLQHLPPGQADLGQGRLHLAANDWAQAEHALRKAQAALPDNPEVRLALGDAYARQGQRQAAYAQAQWLQAHLPQSATTDQLALLRLLQRIPALEAANALAQKLLATAPQDIPVLLHAARLERAQDRYAQALGHFQTAQKQERQTQEDIAYIAENIAAIEARRQAWIETGVVRVGKSSTEGISSLHGHEIPTVAWWPKGYAGHYFLHADRVQLNAGRLPLAQSDALEYGQVAAWPSSAYPTWPGTPRGHGMNLGFGYRGTGLEWDVGVIGAGMPVTNLVGGVSYGEWNEDFNYRVELSRRPITGSLLSYAGAHDPITGNTWGGVVATGLSARVGRPMGPVSTSLSASFAVLQGKNVQNNTRLQLRAAADRDVWQGKYSTVNAGLALSYWSYGKDLSEYTWGHGGYYSPKNYLSLSLPIEWGGRHNKLTWLVRGALSFSSSSSQASPYYPGSAALQGQAQAQGVSPFFDGGRSSGLGRSLRSVVEYQVTRNLALGAQLSLDRSAYYAPTNALLYMRWLIDPVRAPLADRPRPVQPYSDF